VHVGSRRQVYLVALVVVAVLVTAGLLVGVGSRRPAEAQTPVLRVSMYGDSVLLGAKEELLAQFAGQQVTVDAVEDRSLLGAIGLFRSAGPALGDVVVLDLGYNDSSDPAVFRSRIDDAMAALAGVKRVIWLNQHDWGPGRAGMNAELTAAASRYPNLDVVDWNAEVAAHPDAVYADAIHLTPSGQNTMATLVKQRFDQYVESLTPTTTAATTTVPTTTAHAAAPAGTAPAATDDDSGIDGRTIAIAAGAVVALVVVVGGAALVARRRRRRRERRAQRRASSSATSASGSVTGSRQANRSHT
jgi:uncharacterized protein with FMN-binding domain